MDEANNPRKRARKNTTRACDSCKAKKTRCDGTLPCSRCQTYNHHCTYDAPHSRGHKSPIVLAPAHHSTGQDETTTRIDLPSNELSREMTPDAAEGVLGLSSNLAFSHAARVEFTSRVPSPSNITPATGSVPLTDVATGGLGNGLQNVSIKRLYFAEPPFEPLNLVRYSLPDVEHGLEMCSWYFDNASPTYRFLYRPEIERMVRELCRSNEWLQLHAGQDEGKISAGNECTVLMCWALGCQYPVAPRGQSLSPEQREWIRLKGQSYYQVADMVINEKRNSVDSLITLEVRLLMCLYLLTTARLKAAWDLFGTVKHLTNSLDLSRPTIMVEGKTSTLRQTLRARVFWAVYTLDTYLCAMLGKMLTFGERDIKVKHTALDDNEMLLPSTSHPFQPTSPESQELSLMIGPVVHAKLARIVRQALRELYLDYDGQYNTRVAQDLSQEVQKWENELPEIFKLRSSAGLQPLYARQANVLQLARLHALILIHRPSLPLSSLSYQWKDQDNSRPLENVHEHQNYCLDAALLASESVANLLKRDTLTGAFWFSAYIAFCAGTVILVFLGHNMHGLTSQCRQDIWKAAQNCCSIEKKLAPTNRLARRYAAALETLSEQLHKRLTTAEATERSRALNSSHLVDQPPNMHPGVDDMGLYGGTASLDYLGFPVSPNTSTGEGFALETFLTDFDGPTAFFDLDSFVSGGPEFGWS